MHANDRREARPRSHVHVAKSQGAIRHDAAKLVTKNELNTSEWPGARLLNQLRVAKEGGVIPQGAANPLPYNKKQKQQQTETHADGRKRGHEAYYALRKNEERYLKGTADPL